jgi:hypothetical protein
MTIGQSRLAAGFLAQLNDRCCAGTSACGKMVNVIMKEAENKPGYGLLPDGF